MSRRAALPGASELFRATSSTASLSEAAQSPAPAETATPAVRAVPSTTPPAAGGRSRTTTRGGQVESTGRERHDEKITVYLSADELVLLDEAKASLYRDLGMKVDRGRIVREAIAVVIGDLAAKGEASILARRLRER